MTASSQPATDDRALRAGMIGMGMIFDETYRPFFEQAHRQGLYSPSFGVCQVPLAAVASRTGRPGRSVSAGGRGADRASSAAIRRADAA